MVHPLMSQEPKVQISELLERMTDAFFALDTEWRFTYLNHAAETLLGQARGELLGCCLWEKFPATLDTPFETHYRRALEEQTPRHFEEFSTHHGIWYNISVLPSPEGILVSCRDVTARKAAEQAVIEREQQYRLLFASNPHPMWIFDPQTLRFLAVNDTAILAYGYTQEEFARMTLYDIRPAEDFLALERMAAMPLNGVREAGEWRHRCKNGSLINVQVTTHSIDWEGHVARLTTAVDITTRKSLETELQAAYDREHRIAETLQRSHLLTHAVDGFPGLAVEPLYRAAWSEALVGGDFFDSFALPDGRVALVVGDMVGKGLIAATRTAEIKYALRAYLHQCLDAARTLHFLNHYLCDTRVAGDEVAGAFVTVSLVVVDAETGAMEIASAGAEPPRVLIPEGRIVTIDGGGLPLGIDPAERYDVILAEIAPAETLVLITDGIAEAGRGRGDALENALLPVVEMPLRDRGRRILAAARELSGGTLQDDACILLAQRR